MAESCDDTCPVCGGATDDFSALVLRLEQAWDGHDEGEAIEALCLVLGGIIALEPAETRPKLRSQVNRLLTDTTKFHVVQNCDA